MGGVLKAAPIEQATVEFIRAGGDLALLCHLEKGIVRSHEALIAEAERDPKFARRVMESTARTLAFKKRSPGLKCGTAPPKPAKVQRLSRQLWEFGEQVRLENLKQQVQL
jgi:hypothetical protein